MKTFDVIIGKSVGEIVFGMPRNEARLLLGEYREFNNNLVKMNSFDQFAFCHLGYDENDKVEFVCFTVLKDVELKLENRIISRMSSLQLFAYVNKLDNTVELEESGISFESNTLGVAAYFEKTPATDTNTGEEIIFEKLASVTIAVPGYWNKYKD
jgi:hypothetical protein